MGMEQFHTLIGQWFASRFKAPTDAQQLGWPSIAANHHTLIAAPTGSGKTLAAFLVCIDRLWRQWLAGELSDGIQVVYVSPLKALSNDIEKNLQQPLSEICSLALAAGEAPAPLRVAVRTGDTPSAQRQAMLRRPPHILVTTPESLYLLLTSERAREQLRGVRTVIVDEIHAVARDKRGSHLSLSLERLAQLAIRRPVRIGLSATQRPLDEIARFLVGSACGSVQYQQKQHKPQELEANDVVVVDSGHVRQLDLAIEVPPSELAALCTHEQWGEIYEQITDLVRSHRSTLIFVNTRRLAERVTLRLSELLGAGAVASHHGSLSREIRLSAERKLKSGELKAIVATASLEMGIDIGYIDLVCQIGSPRSIATFLQRVGRSGHNLGAIPKGRLFPLTRDELLECLALVHAVKLGQLDSIEIPAAPLDILAQQIVAAVACEDWQDDELYEFVCRAWPYRNLTRENFSAIVKILADGITPTSRRGAYLHHDQINGRLRARRSARLTAITSGGAIPETADYRVVTEPDKTFVGTVDEDFAIESMAGDIFLLGNTSWQILQVRANEVAVIDAQGAPPTIPFWFGEAPGRTVELCDQLSELRREVAHRLQTDSTTTPSPSGEEGADAPIEVAHLAQSEPEASAREQPASAHKLSLADASGSEKAANPTSLAHAGAKSATSRDAPQDNEDTAALAAAVAWLVAHCGTTSWGAEQAARYVAAQVAAIGLVPTNRQVVFERFFDESGGMQLVIHAPFGARINRAWGLALRKRFCRSFDFELQAAATDNGVLLSIGPQHSFPIDALFKMIGLHNATHLLEQAVLAAPMFQVRWRWNVTRALAVLRNQAGKKVPPPIQRFRSDDLLASAFPQTVGCLENHHGDIEIPVHPLVQQTMYDCLHEAMDVDRWLAMLADVDRGEVQLLARETREPSPFSHELLNANPYAFLDDAPLEERRARAVQTRRTLAPSEVRDLGRLDEAAIEQVRQEAWPVVRDADELHDALRSLGVLPVQTGDWQTWYDSLASCGRAATVVHGGERKWWVASESWPVIRAIFPDARAEPVIQLPESLDRHPERSAALVELLRGLLESRGPVTAADLARELVIGQPQIEAALECLESEGTVLRGEFSAAAANGTEWCDRRLLARIHRLTVDRLRRQIEPVSAADYLKFLVARHRLAGPAKWSGRSGVLEAVQTLQGFDLPAGAWETVLGQRVREYDPEWLDQLFLSGEVIWGRLRPPRSGDGQTANRATLSRVTPISLLLRTNLGWLLPADRVAPSPGMSAAVELYALLDQRGARFVQELIAMSSRLPSEVEEALRELAALGLATSDTFAALRSLARLGRRRQRAVTSNTATGRWSCFVDEGVSVADESEAIQHWCRLLLRRYGVVFRDLLERESACPRWNILVREFRRMELRGDIRGGRFVADVGGEQYAEDAVVEQLRQQRDTQASEWVLVPAADPLNLAGIVGGGARVTANHRNLLILKGGQWVAARISGTIQFYAPLDEGEQQEMRRALQTGRQLPSRPAGRETAAGDTSHWPRRSRPDWHQATKPR